MTFQHPSMPQQQLLLDLKPEQPPTLENFVAGANTELLSRLRLLTQPHCFESIYLWGPAGSGKSHLLAATAGAAQRPATFLAAQKLPEGTHGAGTDTTVGAGSLLIIDDVEQLSADAQIVLFRLFNAARFLGLTLLLSGSEPPLRLALREDLRTRIGQMLIYQVQPLSDSEKAAALQRHAVERGMLMDSGVVQYLLRHGRRDLPSLITMLDHLDRVSLEQHRAPTLPLLRELMQTSFDLNPP
jgi:DnaA family protein